MWCARVVRIWSNHWCWRCFGDIVFLIHLLYIFCISKRWRFSIRIISLLEIGLHLKCQLAASGRRRWWFGLSWCIMKPPVIVVAVDDSADVEAASNSFIMLGRMRGRLKMPGLQALSAVWSLTFVRHDRPVANSTLNRHCSASLQPFRTIEVWFYICYEGWRIQICDIYLR